jgi:Protein of unknown function (DUF3800)
MSDSKLRKARPHSSGPVADEWCFIDESWQEGGPEHIGVLGAVVCSWTAHEALSREMFRVRRKYYGEDHARDHTRELKGKELLSNGTFKLAAQLGHSKNHWIAREILEFAHQAGLKIAAGSVYGATQPPLLSPDPKQLAVPFRELCHRLLAHLPDHAHGHLVFDQRLGAQEGISIAIHNYLAGIKNPPLRLRSLPLVAVSNVCAGLQLADIVAFIVARYSAGDDRFIPWYRLVSRLQIVSPDFNQRIVYGLFRLDWDGHDEFRPRRIRIKKEEPGASGKEAS